MSEILVTVSHIKNAGLCMRGARVWFARHDLDFATFLQSGLPISQIERVGDGLSDLVCAAAREDEL